MDAAEGTATAASSRSCYTVAWSPRAPSPNTVVGEGINLFDPVGEICECSGRLWVLSLILMSTFGRFMIEYCGHELYFRGGETQSLAALGKRGLAALTAWPRGLWYWKSMGLISLFCHGPFH